MAARGLLGGLALLLAACGAEGKTFAPPSPLVVTATPPQVIIVTNTPTPSTTPVLAPTLPQDVPTSVGSAASPLPQLPTLTPTFTPTPTNTRGAPNAYIGPVGGDPRNNLSLGGVASNPSPTSSVQASLAPAPVGTLTACGGAVGGELGAFLSANLDLATQLGCPLGEKIALPNAYQPYERGAMLWLGTGENGTIYVFFNTGAYQQMVDTWREGLDPVAGGESPPNGLFEPIRGFGKIWREVASVREALGWATAPEQGGQAARWTFEGGEALSLPQSGQVYLLVGGRWLSFGGSF